MKKVFFFISNLNVGGAEKVLVSLVNNIDRNEFVPTVLLFHYEGQLIHDLRSDVEIINLGVRTRYSYFKINKILRKLKPDVVFFGIGEVNTICSIFIPFWPRQILYIARETNIISLHIRNIFLKVFYKFFYRNFDYVIAQSDDMLRDLLKYNVNENKIIKINNPIDLKKIQLVLEAPEIVLPRDKKQILAIGSLTERKGFDNLLIAYSYLKRKDVHLNIVGKDLGMLPRLKLLVKELGLEENVTFWGFQSKVIHFLNSADLFILSSNYEGFPNVVLESLACGVPVLSNNCLGGITELIKPGINGAISDINQPDLFASEISACLDKNFDKNIIKATVKKFDMNIIIHQYSKVFKMKK